MSVIPFGVVGAVLGPLDPRLGRHLLLGARHRRALGRRRERLPRHGAQHQQPTATQGLELTDAVRTASVLRFRPIVLTTATTFFGLLAAHVRSTQSLRCPIVPMAISLGCGVLYAAIMTLFLVPVGYVILDDLIRMRAGSGARSATQTQPGTRRNDQPRRIELSDAAPTRSCSPLTAARRMLRPEPDSAVPRPPPERTESRAHPTPTKSA